MPVDESILLSHLMQDRVRLMSLVWAIVHDHHVAEDVFQELLVRAVRNREKIDGPRAILPWAQTVIRNLAVDHVRSRARNPVQFDDRLIDLIEEEWAEQSLGSNAAMTDALTECLDELPPRSRKVIDCRYRDAMNGKEVAEATGYTPQSVYVILSRIHRTLEQCIRRRLGDEGATDE